MCTWKYAIACESENLVLDCLEEPLLVSGTMCYMSGSVQTENNAPVENNLLASFFQWLVGKQQPTVTYSILHL